MYYASIRYASSKVERALVAEIWRHGKNIVFADSEEGARFPSEFLPLLKDFAERRSLFAAVLSSYLTHPEPWNILGTTIVRRDDDANMQRYLKAALCYELARCFARTKQAFEHKYRYNYIHAYSSAMLAGAPTDLGFFKDTVCYLRLRGSRNFSRRADRLDSFAQVVISRWSELPEELRRETTSALQSHGCRAASAMPSILGRR
jgi:hypothetical protein